MDAMPEPELTVRYARDEDVPAILEHLQVSFGGWPKVETTASPLEHLRWKMGYPGRAHHFIGEMDEKIVAVHLIHVWPFKVGDRELNARHGWDAAVHPDYRGQGIMSTFRKRTETPTLADVQFLLGTTGHEAMAALHSREGRERFARPWQVLVCPLTLRAAVSALKVRRGRSPKKLARSLAALARWAMGRGPRRSSEDGASAWTIRGAERFDGRIDAFFKAAAKPFDFIRLRTSDFLNWRYADKRAGTFWIRMAEQDGTMLGYTVLRAMSGTGYIADMLALPGRDDVLESLTRDAIDQLRLSDVTAIECWTFANHPYVPVLRNGGFVGERRAQAPTFRPVTVSREEMAFLSERTAIIHLMLGDMDVI